MTPLAGFNLISSLLTNGVCMHIDDRIIRVNEAMTKTGAGCRATLYNWVKAGLLPKPIKIGPRASGWRESTLNAYIASREAASAPQS
jgi:prophage regulatory protein